MRPESPAVISISHSLPTGFGRASAASSDLRRGDKIGTLQNFVFCLLGLGRSRPPQRENAIWNFRLMSCSWAGLATNAAGMLIHSALVCAFAPSYPRYARLHPGALRSAPQQLSLVTGGDSDTAPGEGDLTLDLFAQELARNAATVEAETAAVMAEVAEDAASRARQQANYAKKTARNDAHAAMASAGPSRLSEQTGGQIIQEAGRSGRYSELSKTHVRRLVGQFGEEAAKAEACLEEAEAEAEAARVARGSAKEAELKEVVTECALVAEARAARFLEAMVGALHMKVRRQTSVPPTYLAHRPATRASARAPTHIHTLRWRRWAS